MMGMETLFEQLAGRGPGPLSVSVIDSGVFSDLITESQGRRARRGEAGGGAVSGGGSSFQELDLPPPVEPG